MPAKTKRRQRDAKTTLILFLLVLAFIAELLFYTWCRVQYVRVQYEIAEETARRHRLMKTQDVLKIELARLKSPRRIAKIATRLGLVVPRPEQTMVLP